MKENGIYLTEDNLAAQRLKEAAEKAKCELSTTRSFKMHSFLKNANLLKILDFPIKMRLTQLREKTKFQGRKRSMP